MKIKKIVATTLVMAMALSFAACSASGTKTMQKALTEEDWTEYEYKDFKKLDGSDDEIEDGVFLYTTDEKDIKKQIKKFYYSDVDEDDVASFLMGAKRFTHDNSSRVAVVAIEFKDKDSAEDAFDDIYDLFEDDSKGDYLKTIGYEDADEDDYYILYVNDGDNYITKAVYLEGKTVIIIDGSGYDKNGKKMSEEIDAICEDAKLQVPSDI